jgi:hypothetical protein
MIIETVRTTIIIIIIIITIMIVITMMIVETVETVTTIEIVMIAEIVVIIEIAAGLVVDFQVDMKVVYMKKVKEVDKIAEI